MTTGWVYHSGRPFYGAIPALPDEDIRKSRGARVKEINTTASPPVLGGSPKHNCWVDPFTIKQLTKLSPSSVVDIGCGDGFYGKLCKRVLGDSVTVTGIDANPKWYNHCKRLEEYSEVIHGCILEVLPQLEGELVIAGDVLEHLEEADMKKVVKDLCSSFKYVIINSPLGFQPQDHVDIWERHRCGLDRKTFDAYPVIEYNESSHMGNEMFNILIARNTNLSKVKKTNKIVVMGFPHCGTTILRKLIGNSPEVHDIQHETTHMPNIDVTEENAIIKFTCADIDSSLGSYTDFKVVAIIKSPFDVFGSMNRRFNDQNPENHTILDWDKYAKSFIKYTEKPVDNVHTVRYEDLFTNSYEQVQNIYKFLGLQFNEDIITTKRDVYISPTCVDIPLEQPQGYTEGVQHGQYRTWQTNQPFKNKTGESRKYLSDEQEEIISSLETTKKLKY
jgi:hypothetical protein